MSIWDDIRRTVLVKKETELTITGISVNVLSNVCELARRRVSDANGDAPHGSVDEFDEEETYAIRAFLTRVFDET